MNIPSLPVGHGCKLVAGSVLTFDWPRNTVQAVWILSSSGAAQSLVWRLSKKLLPTITPMTVPKIAPATKSENQWMVIETPKPTYKA
jgi:hypothetical protein